jgi:hypothetical protein
MGAAANHALEGVAVGVDEPREEQARTQVVDHDGSVVFEGGVRVSERHDSSAAIELEHRFAKQLGLTL